MGKVAVILSNINGKKGYDIKIKAPEATVQDYIDALDDFIETSGCYRSRQPELETCMGCDLCCQERIPVTIVDALNMAEGDLEKAFAAYLHVYVEERVVDITMALDPSGKCVMLNKDRGLCGTYGNRSLVCHTFVCCPSTRNARQLREEIVNAGEDELVRAWFRVRDLKGNLIIHDALEPTPDYRDYPETPFKGCSDYSKIKLKKICSPQLWKKLIS